MKFALSPLILLAAAPLAAFAEHKACKDGLNYCGWVLIDYYGKPSCIMFWLHGIILRSAAQVGRRLNWLDLSPILKLLHGTFSFTAYLERMLSTIKPATMVAISRDTTSLIFANVSRFFHPVLFPRA